MKNVQNIKKQPNEKPERYFLEDPSIPEHCTTGFLGISVGCPPHEGSIFRATAKWCGQNFNHVVVEVADTLQRHNLILDGASEAEALEITLDKGRQWIERNRKALMDIAQRTSLEIIRWDKWLDHPDFEQKNQSIHFLYKNSKEFKTIVDQNVRTGDEIKHQTSLNYILEEIAIAALMFETYPNCVHLYPAPFFDELWSFFKAEPQKGLEILSNAKCAELKIRENPHYLHKDASYALRDAIEAVEEAA